MSRIRALGCDISSYQGAVDFKKMKDSGITFVYIKASQNLYESEVFKDQWKAAKEAGLLRGAYAFYDLRATAVSAKEQAEFFSGVLADDWGELRPALDFENPGKGNYPDYPGHSDCQRIVRQFSERVEGNLGVWPMLYTNLAGIQKLEPLTSQLASTDLWVAWYPWHCERSYKVTKPLLRAWPSWRFWQYKETGDGHGHGVDSTGLDMDVFNGTIDELYDYSNALKKSKHVFRW